jgi:hypothetical protein
MPTLPLYDTTAPPNAYHRVTAPGGYEWWQFRVTSTTAGAPQLMALTFYDGRPHDPDYRERYRKYRVWPTHHAPPVPSEYRGIELTVGTRGSRPSVSFLSCAAERFVVTDDGTELRCGDVGEFRLDGDGSIRASFHTGGTNLEVLFRPRDGVPVEPVATPSVAGVVGQHWQIVAPIAYDATGRFNATRFEGIGTVEHCWGTSPPAQGK